MKTLILILSFLITQNLFAKNLYLIIDSSGSMAGMDEKFKPKMKSAKTAVHNIVDKLPEKTKMALISYGNTKKGDCSDINTLVPFSAVNKKILKDKVDSLKPLGKTPIQGSLKKAISSIKTKENVSLILITDGIESCEGDPCSFVEKLKKQSKISFKVDVIGFDIKSNPESLKCIAEKSGGSYIDAKNSDELLNKTDEMIREELKDKGTLELVDKNKTVLNFKIFDKDGKIVTEGSNYGKIELLPGIYKAEVTQAITKAATTIEDLEIKANKNLFKEVSFDKAIKLKFEWDKDRFGRPVIKDIKTKETFRPYDQVQRSSGGDRKSIQIVAGTYIVKAIGKKNHLSYESDPIKIDKSMTIKLGQERLGKIEFVFIKKVGSLYVKGKNYYGRIWSRKIKGPLDFPVGEYMIRGSKGFKQKVIIKEKGVTKLEI
jgi:Ca-activated chloride channel family protein